jgi:hypothetical protein
MQTPEKRNPGWRAGASNNSQTIGPDLDYAMRCAHQMALGMPLPGDAPQRLNRLALRLFDARSVLEAPLPSEVHQ